MEMGSGFRLRSTSCILLSAKQNYALGVRLETFLVSTVVWGKMVIGKQV